MRIRGRPGHWFLEDEETGEEDGPFTTRSEARAKLENSATGEEAVFRLLIERDENNRISEIKVVPNYDDRPISMKESNEDVNGQ